MCRAALLAEYDTFEGALGVVDSHAAVLPKLSAAILPNVLMASVRNLPKARNRSYTQRMRFDRVACKLCMSQAL